MKIRVCFLVCLVWLISGCALTKSSVRPDEEKDALKVAEVLRYFQWAQQLPAQELQRQYVIQEDRYNREQNDKNRVMLALLLAIPQTEFHDTSRAVDILGGSPALRPQPETSLQNLSSLLLYLLSEQKDQEARYTQVRKQLNSVLEENTDKERQYKKTSQRLSAMLAKIKDQEVLNNQLNEALGKERSRVEALKQKIEQLKLIEKSITDRKNLKEPTT